jgi:hypothetical protein
MNDERFGLNAGRAISSVTALLSKQSIISSLSAQKAPKYVLSLILASLTEGRIRRGHALIISLLADLLAPALGSALTVQERQSGFYQLRCDAEIVVRQIGQDRETIL